MKIAADAHGALALLAQSRPDVILMDLQMPGIDGFELTQLIKKKGETQSIPVIAVTAFAMKRDDERARAAGCDFYITKPIDAKELLTAISRCLQGPAVPVQAEPSVPGYQRLPCQCSLKESWRDPPWISRLR